MNIYNHLATVTLVLEMDIVPEGFTLMEELLEQVSDIVPSIYSRDKPGLYFYQETCHYKFLGDNVMQQRQKEMANDCLSNACFMKGMKEGVARVSENYSRDFKPSVLYQSSSYLIMATFETVLYFFPLETLSAVLQYNSLYTPIFHQLFFAVSFTGLLLKVGVLKGSVLESCSL